MRFEVPLIVNRWDYAADGTDKRARFRWQVSLEPSFLNERREFFQRAFGKILGEVAKRTEERVAPKRWFRPPGAAPEMAFVAACTRCGDCIDVCPVHAILKTPANGGGLAAGTPYIDPRPAPCIACEDMPCAAACETGALTKVPWIPFTWASWSSIHSAASPSRARMRRLRPRLSHWGARARTGRSRTSSAQAGRVRWVRGMCDGLRDAALIN